MYNTTLANDPTGIQALAATSSQRTSAQNLGEDLCPVTFSHEKRLVKAIRSPSRHDHMQNCSDPVIARRRHAETATYCWKHSEHATVHQSSLGDASLRTVNNNRMSGTHRHDGSSRASTTIRHPQDASDTHCRYRHPKDASNHADSKAVGKQQAFATPNGMLAKNPANPYKATVIKLTTSRATLTEDTDDAYASSDIRNYVHHTTNTERCAKGSNTSCPVIPPQQNVINTCMMNHGPMLQYSGSISGLEQFISRMESIIRADDISRQHCPELLIRLLKG